MKQIKILTYSRKFFLSNKYLKAIIQYVGPTTFNEKVEGLFNKKIVSNFNFLIKYLKF